jgi:predicted O-methyltransferase YrrM
MFVQLPSEVAMPRQVNLSEPLLAYLYDVSLREPEALRRLREETARHESAGMQISPDQGQLLALLVRLIGARRCLEIGTFTGYSALAVALALPEDGRLVCCDVSEEYTAMARRAWAGAGVAAKIELRLAPARDTLGRLLAAGHRGEFDFAFIDADKENYDHYYEAALELVRRGGLIAIDNVLWSGAVADPAIQDIDTNTLRALNLKLRDDERIDLSMLAIGDGLTLARIR